MFNTIINKQKYIKAGLMSDIRKNGEDIIAGTMFNNNNMQTNITAGLMFNIGNLERI